MSLFKRIKNIIKSNINYSETPTNFQESRPDIELDLNSYTDTYFDDAKDIPETNSQEKKYYKILEVEYGADFKEIKKSYKRLLKKYHPDLYINQPEKLEAAQKVSAKINEAYTYFERKYL